jgi:hypothetical protein
VSNEPSAPDAPGKAEILAAAQKYGWERTSGSIPEEVAFIWTAPVSPATRTFILKVRFVDLTGTRVADAHCFSVVTGLRLIQGGKREILKALKEIPTRIWVRS